MMQGGMRRDESPTGNSTETHGTPGMSRRKFLSASGASLGMGLAASSGLGQRAEASVASGQAAGGLARRPNLILFMPDEMRAEGLACYGNPVVKTPNLDRLAAEGTRFANAHVQFPVCGASRCSLLTGWPTSVRGHRSLYYFLRPEEPNLFRYLQQSGYDVYWYGKNDALASQTFAGSVTEWNHSGGEAVHGKLGWPRNPWPVGDPMYYSFLYPEGGDRRDYGDYANLQAAVRILERREQERPFCIFLPLASPHPPYTAPKGFHNLYNPADLPPLRPIGLPRRPAYMSGIRESYRLTGLGEAVFRKIQAVYLGMVSYTDWLLGEMMEALQRTGHEQDTALFVLSDHGDYGGDYGLVEKWPSGLEDVLTHVPIIARIPGGARGHVAEEMVELFDVMATCLDLAGVEAQHTHFARSLRPQLEGRPGDPQRAAFCEGGYNVYEPQCFEPALDPAEIYAPKSELQRTRPETICRSSMVRTREHKLVVRSNGENEFYDYRSDPRELHNRYGEQSLRGAQQALEGRLLQWYLNATGIAPFDKDPRNPPPYYPTAQFPPSDWHRDLLDRGLE